ncbi:hypothetical protein JG687_00013883 [Phytophthora cactorum]|uniref:Uncharacterized protein n=1 Tax=Phytophthora cactorum TaxID=29920 RepID=A0A329RKV3_9STRA|nr:hypothetical protein Pcac1_g28325 [Phytophthora cactorum]KAG2808922.1 hypothetical protein PC111_g16285 [Phytophthora cactorum]KAG2844491.1 hypothetical protein PC112_g2203 [Phytophthora cactorum]KAG2847475.1 hypothetical protein PC113_g17759 [Phytophthora cactorum]KAG2888003.1 hypothetical protein PC114_g18580 [Phytophthora cactorum]
MDNYSQSPENGSEEADGELPVVTDGEDVEERIVGPIDTSDWDSTGSATISAAANANIVALKDSNGLHLVDEKEPSARTEITVSLDQDLQQTFRGTSSSKSKGTTY